MLLKLFKLDIKFAYKRFLLMIGVMLCFGIALPIIDPRMAGSGTMSIFMISMIVIVVLSVYIIIQHFHHNLFGDEGYMMFTLPVKAWQLLMSKLLTTLMWFNLMLLSGGVMALLITRSGYDSFSGVFEMLFSKDIFSIVANMFITINASIIPTIMVVYFGIALSTLSVRGKTLGFLPSIVSVIGLGVLYNWGMVALVGFFVEKFPSSSNMMSYGVSVALALIAAAVLFTLTNYLMKRKLNLK